MITSHKCESNEQIAFLLPKQNLISKDSSPSIADRINSLEPLKLKEKIPEEPWHFHATLNGVRNPIEPSELVIRKKEEERKKALEHISNVDRDNRLKLTPEYEFLNGEYFYYGVMGSPIDFNQAINDLKRSAKGGNLNALNKLGEFYMNELMPLEKGENALQSAYSYFFKAAQQNHPIAIYNLSRIIMVKSIIKGADLEIISLGNREKGAIPGILSSFSKNGLSRKIIDRNIYYKTQSIELWKKAYTLIHQEALKGDPHHLYYFYQCITDYASYLKDSCLNDGMTACLFSFHQTLHIEARLKEAEILEERRINILKQSANLGDRDAQNALGDYYLEKRNGSLDLESLTLFDFIYRKYERLAFQWYSNAARQGHPEAKVSLADMYHKGCFMDGEIQVQDIDQCYDLLQEASLQQNRTAKYELAIMINDQTIVRGKELERKLSVIKNFLAEIISNEPLETSLGKQAREFLKEIESEIQGEKEDSNPQN